MPDICQIDCQNVCHIYRMSEYMSEKLSEYRIYYPNICLDMSWWESNHRDGTWGMPNISKMFVLDLEDRVSRFFRADRATLINHYGYLAPLCGPNHQIQEKNGECFWSGCGLVCF